MVRQAPAQSPATRKAARRSSGSFLSQSKKGKHGDDIDDAANHLNNAVHGDILISLVSVSPTGDGPY